MDDYIARAVTLDGYVRIFAAKTTDLVNEAVKIHHCAPTAAAALGRALTAAALMGATLKDEESSITLQIDGGGPIGKICAITDKNCYVRGYCDDPTVDLPLKKDGKLDVGKAVGTNGYLNVIRDYGLKKPYIGRAELVSGEIGEDLTRYYAISEQVPSAVGLGVLVDTDYTIKAAGGFIVQLMPGATENHIADIEKALSEIPSVTKMIEMGMKPEDIAEKLLMNFGLLFYENKDTGYFCPCSYERMERALTSIGKKDLTEILKEDGRAELTCHFCNRKFTFNREKIMDLINKAK